MRLFRTGLYSTDVPEKIEWPTFRPRGWQLEIREERFIGQVAKKRRSGLAYPPTAQFRRWLNEVNSRREAEIGQRPIISITKTGAHAGSELFVRAKNRSSAQTALDLIMLGHVLLEPEQFCVGHEINRRIYPLGASDNEPEDTHLPPFHIMGAGLTTAAMIAARLSQRKRWQTAAWRWYYSCMQHYSCWKETHPFYSDHKRLSDDPKDFLVYANAIQLAYSVLEDLRLAVNASSQKPSMLDGGVKNPAVWNDLRQRLIEARVDPDWKVLWKSRTPVTRITKARKLDGQRAPWGRSDVYDKEVSTLDAIFHLSFLRSKAGAHGSLAFSRSLSIYDVENAQMLVWCVLRQTIGFG